MIKKFNVKKKKYKNKNNKMEYWVLELDLRSSKYEYEDEIWAEY